MTGRGKLLLAEAWRSLGANISTTVAATLTVLIGMFLLGLFIALGTWTLSWSNHVKQELMVKVYFVHNAPASDVNALVRQLNQNSLVKPGGVKYTSQDAGFAQMKKQYPQITDEVPSNPLGPRLDVTPARAEDVAKLYSSIVQNGTPAGVDQVTDGKQFS